MVRLQRSLAFLVAVTAAAVSLAQGFTFTIIHANDVHSHVEPTVIRNRDTGTEVRLGGLSQAANLMQRLRRESTNPLLLHAGDAFQGTIYFNVYQGLSDAALMNLMGWQAMAVGNHEFDLGPKALADFAAQVRFPVLAANLDVSEEPLLKDRVKRSAILNTPGGRVGVVGAVTPDTPNISSPGPTVKFLPLAESVQAEVDMLTVQGVQAIVLLSHCGFTTDLELATQLRGVDVVVGGHSHTFLGRLEGPGLPRSQGDYPTVVRGLDGNRTLVVQAWEWAKLIGRLEVTLDDAGNVQAWKGAPELVDGRDGTNPVMDAIKAA
ncbi:MAG: metallophosphoesterase, partial [Fimbriimonadaceae bacterium]|nr:metallophosphoesterase [Fimbriimonadaceae bacterium]